MTNPVIVPEGFPDLFTFTLMDVLRTEMAEVGVETVLSRPLTASDPSRSVGVVEEDAEPAGYETGHGIEPANLRWRVIIQVLVKASNEVDGRNTRRRLMKSARKALFLPSTVQALMTLSDDTDRASSCRLHRLTFNAVEARDANKTFFLLGQIEVAFETERL